jgi:tetratricopeptide (TPR) repeat protein
MQAASSILHFLQTHCTKEAGTYWLCRPQGSDEIQLYCLDDGESGQAAAPSALSQPVGLLCFKIARRLQMQDREACAAGRGASSKNRERTARLFCNAISVLDEGLHPTVVSLSHEGLADAMVGAQWASPAAQCAGPVAAQCAGPNHHATATAPNQQQQQACSSGSFAAEATLAASPATPPTSATAAAADGEPEAEAQFYVDENGDLQDAKAGGGHLDEDEAPRAGVGDTAQWGAAYSLPDLENAESHYIQAANVRSIALSAHERAAAAAAPARCHQRAPARGKGLHMRWSKEKTESEEEHGIVMAAVVSRRLRCKAGKCAIAIAMRLLRKGGVAEALIKAVNAFDRCVGGQSREEQEVVSEAMEVWADVHVTLAGLTRDQVLKIRGEVEEIQEQERILSAGTFDFTPKSPASETQAGSSSEREAGGRDMTPMSHPLSPDIEDNCNHAIRYLIRSLQFCNAVCRRRDLSKKLAAVYSQLGAHYMSMGRFTRAHQHYQQGTQLFQSIGDEEAAATLTFKLACLFSARAHAAPMSVGLTAEQQTDLFKARSLVLQAYQILQAKQEAMVAKETSRRMGKEGVGPAVLAAPPPPPPPPPYPLCRAHKALKEMVAQVEEELADIHMAIAVGKLHATGVTPPYLLATNAPPRTSPLGEDEGSLESESAESGLSRALSTYESLGLPQAAAAHLHLAFLMWRVEAEAAAQLNKAVGEDRGAAVRAVKTWRQRSERHAQQAFALAKTVADKVRVTCIRAELAMKRADTGCVGGVVAAVEALLQLPQLASNCRPHAAPSCCSAPQEQGVGGGAGYATAAQFGQARYTHPH